MSISYRNFSVSYHLKFVPASLAIYHLHPCSTNILPSLHRQPLMTHVPPSLAIYHLHPCTTNILPSLHRQPLMIHVPPSLAIYQLHPCTTNILPSLHRQPLMTHVHHLWLNLFHPRQLAVHHRAFLFTSPCNNLVSSKFWELSVQQMLIRSLSHYLRLLSGSYSVHLTMHPSPLVIHK